MIIGMIQFAGSLDKNANIARATELIEEAASRGAEFVCLHELATTTYFPLVADEKYFDWAESIPGKTTEYFASVASRCNVELVLPMFERWAGIEYFNSAAVIEPEGTVRGVYRKNSIPLANTSSNGDASSEGYYFLPGNKRFPVFKTAAGATIGILIGFDRHYPEHFRLLALAGAQVIFVPTTSAHEDEDSWFFELQAAAFNNSCWVAAVNRVGYDETDGGNHWFGQSVLIRPSGDIAACGNGNEAEVVVVECDLTEADEIRAGWGFFRDRRPESYTRLVR
jgi:beta-ureidopropionase